MCSICGNNVSENSVVLCPSITDYFFHERPFINLQTLHENHPFPLPVIREQQRILKEVNISRSQVSLTSSKSKRKQQEELSMMDEEEFLEHKKDFCLLRCHISCLAKIFLKNDVYLSKTSSDVFSLLKKCLSFKNLGYFICC